MRGVVGLVAVLGLAGCGDPVPYCDEILFASPAAECAEDPWFARCADGTEPTCASADSEPLCDDGSAPVCRQCASRTDPICDLESAE